MCTQGRAKKAVPAQKLWFAIMEAQVETGNPYMLYKDACNRKSNQQNLGTIKSSNLCTEIVEFTSPEETAVCNLASIALPRFVRENVSTNAHPWSTNGSIHGTPMVTHGVPMLVYSPNAAPGAPLDPLALAWLGNVRCTVSSVLVRVLRPSFMRNAPTEFF